MLDKERLRQWWNALKQAEKEQKRRATAETKEILADGWKR